MIKRLINLISNIKVYKDKFIVFLKEVRKEVFPPEGKVSWPNKRAIGGATLIVVIILSIIGLFIWIIDQISFLMITFIITKLL